MTAPKIPADILRNAARALRDGEYRIDDVLNAVLVDLRAAGWIVSARQQTAPGILDDGHPDEVFLSWPREMSIPYFDGKKGSYTIAPWSVKLTPQPPAPAERPLGFPPPADRVPFMGEAVVYLGDDCIGRTERPAIFVGPAPHVGCVLCVFTDTGPFMVRDPARASWRFSNEPFTGVRIPDPKGQ